MTERETFARAELKRAGWFANDPVYKGAIAESVIELLAVFEKQEHSAVSGELTVLLFRKLIFFESLSQPTT